MRLFIAIGIEEGLTQNIKSLIAQLRGTFQGVRWVREDGIHITLKFLGEVDQGRSDEVIRSLAQVSSRHAEMHIHISRLGQFPEKGIPRVIWLGAREDTGALKKLAADIEEEMATIGFEKEKREFKPHITLGRVKKYQRVGKDLSKKWESGEVSFGSFRADRIFLIKSTLHPDGAQYEKIGSFSFKKQESHSK